MFSELTRVFRVVDDCPPQARLWTEEPPDEWDAPLWTAAERSGAVFIVTTNLDDGPPPGPDGVQEYAGIFVAHREVSIAFVDGLVERYLAREPSLTSLLADPWSKARFSRYDHQILSALVRRGPGRATP